MARLPEDLPLPIRAAVLLCKNGGDSRGNKTRLVREFGKDHTAKETLLFSARLLGLDASVYDGGPGSGYFGHKGRPGKRGGSTSEGGSGSMEGSKRADENVPVDAEGSITLHENESTFNQLRERQKAWHDKLEKEKTAVIRAASWKVQFRLMKHT